MNRLLTSLFILGVLGYTLAACGDDSSDSDPYRSLAPKISTCTPVEYSGIGKPDALITSDLPLGGDSKQRSQQEADAIRLILSERGWKAGKTKIAYQSCDDTSKKTGNWDAGTCTNNAHGYAEDRKLLGVIGTYNSGCAALIIPILNGASDGPVAMVSPGNTWVCLTEPSPTSCKASEPDSFYPTDQRNYARVVPNDAHQGAGLSLFIQKEGVKKLYVLYGDDDVSAGQGATVRNAARSLGIDVVGSTQWNSKADNYKSLMKKVVESGADGVVLAGLTEQNGGQIIKDKVEVVGPNSKVKLFATDGLVQQSTIDAAGKASQDMFGTIPGVVPDHLSGAGKSFVDQFKKELNGQPVEPYAPYAAEATNVLLDAIEKADGKRDKVAQALLATKVKNGILGTFSFTSTGDPSVGQITVYRASDSFTPTQVETPDNKLVRDALG